MENFKPQSLIEVTCAAMPEIVRRELEKDKRLIGADVEKICELAVSAVRAKEINLLTRGALEEKILAIAAEIEK